ncbi:MAG: hypothetical protein AVDCRST_MAG93-2949 [uncultured Chloroflexia bacterium]|uniref:Uncharacterized protein n=1 Tax=uncultured Chloroflexia bacterium TaxID=1672391 RepID=A0A6J4JDT6_9CHLR|nr:MAG: hypothetical protein AVDCRST_MAG93-2949 [uncultured Chloroflexia bacterium]
MTLWQAQLKNVEKEHLHIQAREGMPSPHVADKIAKYEAHIERTLYRAMHELEAMQERRLGKPAPLARLEVHGMEQFVLEFLW